MKILIACEFSGVVRDAFISRGHDAVSCDLLPTEVEGPHYQGDVFDILDDNWDMIIAHPPCTYLTVTGNRWFNVEKYGEKAIQRKKDRIDAIDFFMQLANANCDRIAVENPIGIMSTQWRKPDQIIQPYQFGHIEAKKTALWLKGLPKLKPTELVEPEYIEYASGKRVAKWYAEAWSLPKEERTKVRSKTFTGIAQAMAEQWG